MEETKLAHELLDNLGLYLLNNVDDIKILLDAARADLDEIAARLAEAKARLSRVRHLAGEVIATPMTVEQRQAACVAVEEAYDDIRASSLRLVERRRKLRQVVTLLLLLRASVFLMRAARLLPRVLFTATVGSAAVVVYAESRRGVVPAFRSLARIFALVICGFFECYRVGLWL